MFTGLTRSKILPAINIGWSSIMEGCWLYLTWSKILNTLITFYHGRRHHCWSGTDGWWVARPLESVVWTWEWLTLDWRWIDMGLIDMIDMGVIDIGLTWDWRGSDWPTDPHIIRQWNTCYLDGWKHPFHWNGPWLALVRQSLIVS